EAEDAERDAGDRVGGMEREASAAGEEAPEDQLAEAGGADRSDGQPVAAQRVAARERDAGEHDHEQEERERARGERQRGERGKAPARVRLQRPDRKQRERDPECERERGGEYDPGPDDGEAAAGPACRRSPFPPEDDGE